MEYTLGKTGEGTKDSTRRIRSMAMGSTFGQMAASTKGTGKMGNSMEKESTI